MSSRMASFEKALPTEQWWQVLVNVPPKDLCNVMLTSRYLATVASCPKLWAGMKVNMRKVKENGLAGLYSINRFKRIKTMKFCGMHFTSEELERILNDIPGSPLVNVNIKFVNLSEVSSELLARIVSSLQIVKLRDTKLTTQQCVKVTESIVSSNTLVHVVLSYVNLSGVPADLLAQAVCGLETARLNKTQLTTEQCIEILQASLISNTLVHVYLRYNNLSGVPDELLARAVSRFQTAVLFSNRLTTEKIVKLLEFSLLSTTLETLTLGIGILLSEVPANLLAMAVQRLKNVKIYDRSLTTDQCVKLLKAILSSKSLVKVKLYSVNLSGVEAELLAGAVCRLQTTSLLKPQLTTAQCVKLLESSLTSNTLVNLDLRHVDLSGVPTDLLTRAICHQEKANLSYTRLTADQCVSVVNAIITSTITLRKLNLKGNKIQDKVPASLLASLPINAKSKCTF